MIIIKCFRENETELMVRFVVRQGNLLNYWRGIAMASHQINGIPLNEPNR